VAVLLYAAIASVSAAPAPIRLLVVSSSIENDSPINHLRFGHPVPPYNSKPETDLAPPPLGFPVPPTHIPPEIDGPVFPGGRRFRHRPGCHGRKGKLAIFMHGIKIKAIKIGNCFRKALGWPLIQVNHHHHHHHHRPNHADHPNHDEDSARIRVDGGLVNILPALEPDHRDWSHHIHRGTFLSRLHHSLMNLGRWEGRAVAFVIGCGIGVLIRMFWVLAIVSYRACRGYRDVEYTIVAVMEDSDVDQTIPKPEPPKYVYPVDEKIAVEETT